MIWPANLVTAALFNTLHAQETSGTYSRGGLRRGRFFLYVFVGYIIYSQSFRLRKRVFLILIRYCRRLLAVLSLHRSFVLLLDLLDGSQQCQNQPNVRRHSRHGHGSPHL
jgi:hypothetical protein